MTDALRRLARPDKWYLGAGDSLLWAPPFPVWLDAPGFWDEAHLFQYAVGPLFTVSFVHEGTVLAARRARHAWTPAALALEHRVGPVRARETRCVAAGSLVSVWEIHNPTRRRLTLDVVVWTALDGATLAAEDVGVARHTLHFTPVVADRCGHRTRVLATLALTPPAQSHAAYRSQVSTPVHPPWLELTPFWDRWYRWYGLRLNGIAAGAAPNYPHPTVCEGIGYFQVPISYSAQCHLRELRWLSDPAWARGVLRTFLTHQKPDGSFHGRIWADHTDGTDFYQTGAARYWHSSRPIPTSGSAARPTAVSPVTANGCGAPATPTRAG